MKKGVRVLEVDCPTQLICTYRYDAFKWALKDGTEKGKVCAPLQALEQGPVVADRDGGRTKR